MPLPLPLIRSQNGSTRVAVSRALHSPAIFRLPFQSFFRHPHRETCVRTLAVTFTLLGLLTGCAAYRTHEARDAQGGKLVGANIVDLVQSVGIPDKTMKIVNTGGPADRMTAQWNFSNSDSALDMTLVLVDVKVGGAGKCTMTATVDRWGGKVIAVNFPQAHSDSIGSDYGACEPLVQEALTHMPRTPIDRKFDAFTLVGAAK
ncbi:hypothetical protein J2801_004911 [Paraburkholderia phenoliruptrix]|uniref:hypothetical protein n=1 Tax=Paraburkholderia phenoliruptrix TaxID=252970 RepID=UPI00285F7F24|nr:hypothetical protein [Paraburkholderia phenoliruptrix]MDR6422619.1 hypothetical protein [Paraburkholderia phenoliruptrix]